MRRAILLLLCLLFATGASAAQTYYVDSASGDDAWLGTLPDPQSGNGPWRSIAKVNVSPFLPGDSVLFKCGGIWRELPLAG